MKYFLRMSLVGTVLSVLDHGANEVAASETEMVIPDIEAWSPRRFLNEQMCDPMERIYAPDCCPVRDPSFEPFCTSLFERSHYSSTGMVEMHKEWIGDFGVAETIPEDEEEENENEDKATEEIILEVPGEETRPDQDRAEKEDELSIPLSTQPAADTEECNDLEKLYAPVCCPVMNDFERFCKAYFKTRRKQNRQLEEEQIITREHEEKSESHQRKMLRPRHK
jgi:hypothetical protein